MANELSTACSVTETKNGATFAKSYTKTVTVTGDTPISTIQSVGTADETLVLGDISSLGYMICKNLDVTNYIEIGYTSGTYFAKLKAGESMLMRAGAGLAAIHAKANTAACVLEYLLIPD